MFDGRFDQHFAEVFAGESRKEETASDPQESKADFPLLTTLLTVVSLLGLSVVTLQ